MGIFERVKGILAPPDGQGGAVEDAPLPKAQPALGAEEEFLDITIVTPQAEAVTCQIQFDREVSPTGTSLFETPQDAVDWPVARALLSIEGVHSVIGKGSVLIVARRDSTPWQAILSQVQGVIQLTVGDPAPARPAAPATSLARSHDAPLTDDEESLRLRVEEVIETEVNPAVAAHGGYIELLDVQGTRVFLHMGGGCQGCAMSTATLKNGVETSLRSRIPEISEILDTTDHAAGSNPYFQG